LRKQNHHSEEQPNQNRELAKLIPIEVVHGHCKKPLERAYEHQPRAEIDVPLAQRIELLLFFGVIL
jgi:hypothetical protein